MQNFWEGPVDAAQFHQQPCLEDSSAIDASIVLIIYIVVSYTIAVAKT